MGDVPGEEFVDALQGDHTSSPKHTSLAQRQRSKQTRKRSRATHSSEIKELCSKQSRLDRIKVKDKARKGLGVLGDELFLLVLKSRHLGLLVLLGTHPDVDGRRTGDDGGFWASLQRLTRG